jgi:ubiquinone/menaquinone biosynthesis C-methylase UbiE
MTNKFDVPATYRQFVQQLSKRHSRDKAMETASGGEFEAIGILERELLIQCGLKPDDYLIDVGCGSGRLAKPLAQYLRGKYLGIDVVPEMLDYARTLVGREDWRFEVASGLAIPEPDGRADMVCFFSVFTHLLHEQSFVYLGDARRVLKPGGSIVFSFLEFAIPSHWAVFAGNVADVGGSQHLNMFMDRDAIRAWAAHLDLEIVSLHDGDKPHIPIPHPLTLEDGRTISNMGSLGQSVAVLRKR